MINHYLPDEPLCRAFGIEQGPFSSRMLWRLRKNVSIMIVTDETKEIIGALICNIEKKDEIFDLNSVTNDNLRGLKCFLTHNDLLLDIYDKYGVTELFHVGNAAVHKKYRHQGLGFILFGAIIALAKELGFRALIGEGTSIAPKRLFEKHGFETVLELSYSDYKHKDNYLRDRIGDHTSMKVYSLYV